MKPTGKYITCSTAGESFKAFVPESLPPAPPLRLKNQDYDLMERANRALGRLDGVTTLLPDSSIFLYFYVRKEAVLSSQIEGTQSSISDLLLHESKLVPGVSLDDVNEVSNYVAAISHGLKRIRKDKFPISLRLMREMHKILLAKGRGKSKRPGEFRKSQNWIGGSRPGNARFVPPPPEYVIECMSDLEKFLNDQPERTPVLIKAALAHVQFETIHPFLDGNGRLGRLLITLLLCSENALQDPLLYLSLFFMQNREEYYDLLDQVRTKGDWLSWLRLFLNGVHDIAQQAVETTKSIQKRLEMDRKKIENLNLRTTIALGVHQMLQRQPFVTVPMVASYLAKSAPTARKAVENLEQMGILREITGKRRDRIYIYDKYVELLDEGTGPVG